MQPNETDIEESKGFDPNSTSGTFIVAVVLCLVCAVAVSLAAVGLRDLQDRNAKNKMMRNVLIAAGIWDDTKHTDADIPTLFENIDTRLWNLPADGKPNGSFNTELSLDSYNQEDAASTPAGSIEIAADADVAGIKRREKVSRVYFVKDDAGKVTSIILPIKGKGLWSTLYGFLAVDATTRESRGITFYKHGETPGLGGEVDNPKWKQKWRGGDSSLLLRGDDGKVSLDVVKPGNASTASQIDGLSGATITSNGVENTIHYWLGPDAFGPFLDEFASGKLDVASADNPPAAKESETPEGESSPAAEGDSAGDGNSAS
ncbi:MAG: Na(+)-translocating NADH-quinone reductase subunit C [Planctomycetaceae bacterium]|nr:Na(+)-translocating NADH-quinone reductase subunit C [Planctomycetaceae bacterium]